MLDRLHGLLIRIYRSLPRAGRLFVVRRLAPSFTVGALCAIERADGSMLCVRHSYRRGWGLPGGLLERNEEAAEGVRREVLEEVGLEVALVGEPSVVVDPQPRRVDLVFRARPVEGVTAQQLDHLEPRSPEIVEIGWFAPDALPQLQHEAAGALVALARSNGAPDGARRSPSHRSSSPPS